MVNISNKSHRKLDPEPGVFEELDSYFHFTLDACASSEASAKCNSYCLTNENPLDVSWEGYTVFCCPPTGRKASYEWTRKAKWEAEEHNVTSVLFLPVSTDTNWFLHNIVMANTTIIYCLRRVKLVDYSLPMIFQEQNPKAAQRTSPRPSMAVVFQPKGKSSRNIRNAFRADTEDNTQKSTYKKDGRIFGIVK